MALGNSNPHTPHFGANRAGCTGVGVIWLKFTCSRPCRCDGALKELLHAAVVAEDMLIHSAYETSICGSDMLAALTPAAGTLRTLHATGMSERVVCPQPCNDR